MNVGFPDVCLTPAAPAPIPVPYPNIAMNAQAVAFSPFVKVSGVNALNMGSIIPMTTGDEGGAAHPTMKGMGKYTMGNPIVFIDKLPAINLACPTTGNMMNNPIGLVAVPSAVNVMYCYAGSFEETLPDDALSALAAEMTASSVEAERLPGGVALVRIGCFSLGLTTEVFRAVRALGGGIAAYVFDLRGCPGGDVEAAVSLAAEVCMAGEVKVSLTEADGDVSCVTRGASARYEGKVIVLVDRGTASAAEVFAALLRDAGRAAIVGQRTYGKRTTQRVLPAPGESQRVQTGTWAVGASTEGAIAPDVELPRAMSEAEAQTWLKTAWALALYA